MEGDWFGTAPVGTMGEGGEEKPSGQEGDTPLLYLSIPRAPSPHHPKSSDVSSRGEHTTAISQVTVTKTTDSKVKMTNSSNPLEAWFIPNRK